MALFDYFKVCNECTDEYCCKEPYYAFMSKGEVQRIKDYLKKENFPKKFSEFIAEEDFEYKNEDYKVLAIRKINGPCIFLKDKRYCMIQDVKPLDCREWPLTFDYDEKKDELTIYKGECPLSDVLDEEWVNDMVERIRRETAQWPIEDLAAYSSYDRDDTLKPIKKFKRFLKK